MKHMKPWIGRWLIAVSVVHTVFAVAVFGDVLASMARRGFFNSVGNDPLTGAVAWFGLFGALLFICGLAASALEKALTAGPPRSIGWSLLALGTVGVTLMPASGFWLVFPPAIAILVRKVPAPGGLDP